MDIWIGRLKAYVDSILGTDLNPKENNLFVSLLYRGSLSIWFFLVLVLLSI